MFTKRLNELLKETNISKTKLSYATGIPLTTMWGWTEKGTHPGADKLIKLADFFECTIDYLLGRSDDIGIINLNNKLTSFQEELIYITNQLNDMDKREIIGFAKSFIK